MPSLTPVERAALAAGLAALALWFAVFLRMGGVNHDVFHAMALARESIALGHVPHRDLYAYAPTRTPVVHHEWLAGVLALAAYRSAGTAGFGFIWWAVSLGIAALSARALAGVRPVTALAAGFLACPLVTYSLFQPLVAQSYSVLLCGLLLLLLARDAGGAKRAWLLAVVPLFILWTNLHGGVVVGFGVVAVCALERRLRGEPWRHLAALAALLAAAILVNPYGWHYYGYLTRALTMPRPHIGQWQPGWFLRLGHAHFGIPFLTMLALYLYALARAGRRFRGALVTALLAAAAMRAHKLLPFFALAWLYSVPAALAATRLGEAFERTARRALPAAGPAFVGLAGLFALLVGANRPWDVSIPARREQGPIQPVHAADYLERTGFRGNVMTYFVHGAYLSWRLYPRVKVSCDARYEAAYPDGHAERNLDLFRTRPEMLDEELRRLPQTDLILTGHRFPVARELARRPEWRLLYSDASFALYSRAGTEPAWISQSAPAPPRPGH